LTFVFQLQNITFVSAFGPELFEAQTTHPSRARFAFSDGRHPIPVSEMASARPLIRMSINLLRRGGRLDSFLHSVDLFLDLTRPPLTFRGRPIWSFRSISASTFLNLQRIFVRLLSTFSTFFDVFRPSNSRDLRDSLGRFSEKSTIARQNVPLDRLSRR
jgi:hypothetical protein